MHSLLAALPVAALMIGLSGADAFADPPPPENAKPLTEVLDPIEKAGDFGYFDEIEWDDGMYEVEYYTKTGTKKKIYIDPVSGAQRP